MRPFANATSMYLALFILLALNGCKNDYPAGFYDPNASYNPSPSITTILPAGIAFAGMDTVVIQGANFSPTLLENTVVFNAQPATLLTSTPTQITLQAPLVLGDSIGVRVEVRGALQISNTMVYKMKAGVAPFGNLAGTELSTSVAVDATGNLYSAYSNGSADAGILKFTAAGTRSTYALQTAGVIQWTGLKMGPAGYLYSARNFRAIYRFVPGGGAASALWLAFPLGTSIADFDFDKDGNCWAGGNNSTIYKIDQNKVITTFPFVGNVHSLRVYNGYLYFSAKVDASEKIWRAPLSSGSIGTPEVYFDFSSAYPGNVPLSVTFSSDGLLYIGTDSKDGLVVVSPTKTYSAPFAYYSASFGTGLYYLAWGAADDLYCSTSNGILLKFTIRGKKSAPYYGSTL